MIVFECLALGALVCGGLLLIVLCAVGLGGFSFQTDKATVSLGYYSFELTSLGKGFPDSQTLQRNSIRNTISK